MRTSEVVMIGVLVNPEQGSIRDATSGGDF